MNTRKRCSEIATPSLNIAETKLYLGKKRANEFPKELTFNYTKPRNSSKPSSQTYKLGFYNDTYIDSLMQSQSIRNPGSGLKNIGNTCFVNSVLQCILYTPPLKNYFYYSNHSQTCKIKGVCFICECGKLSKMTETQNRSIVPLNIIENLKHITCHYTIGRQEDAHEFLLYFISAMEQSSMKYTLSMNKKYTKMKNTYEDDNLIQKIFGGRIISQVKCRNCSSISSTVDKFFDISLDIINTNTLKGSFESFCKVEKLTGDNKYFCDNCKKKVNADKWLTFQQLPRILVLHLKRFDNYQQKIKKHLAYPTEMDLSKYSYESGTKYKYSLSAVLVHSGASANSGHYYCYIHIGNHWYCFNDSSVTKVTEDKVLGLSPYLLFYEKEINIPNQ